MEESGRELWAFGGNKGQNYVFLAGISGGIPYGTCARIWDRIGYIFRE